MGTEEFSGEISVIVPLYNKAATVAACIKSLLSQTVPPKQIIVIDDGSTDGSYNIAVEILKKSPIPYIVEQQENSGVASARNFGAELSSSEFISFLDADDEWDADFSLELLNLVSAYPNATLYSCSHRVNSEFGLRRRVSKVLPEGGSAIIENFLVYMQKRAWLIAQRY